MFTEAQQYVEDFNVLDHTPAAALTAGQMIQLADGRAAMARTDIAASVQGAVLIGGQVQVRNVAIAGNIGDNVYWDEDGTGVDGNTGACTTDASVGDFWIGTLGKALATTDTSAIVELNKINPFLPPFLNRTHVKKIDDYTILGTDNGKVIHFDGSAESDDILIATLTAISSLGDGFSCVVQNDGQDGESQLQLELDAGDKILNPTALDDGDQLHNTLATSVRGDYLLIRTTAAGVYIEEMRGTWADGGA